MDMICPECADTHVNCPHCLDTGWLGGKPDQCFLAECSTAEDRRIAALEAQLADAEGAISMMYGMFRGTDDALLHVKADRDKALAENERLREALLGVSEELQECDFPGYRSRAIDIAEAALAEPKERE